MAKLGLVTIGQTPRPDLEVEFRKFAPTSEIRMIGALDELPRSEIDRMARSPGDYPLHTRLSDGSTADISISELVPLVEACARRLSNEGAQLVVVLCAGDFPEIACSSLVVLPGRIVPAVVKAISRNQMIGVVTPIAGQVSAAAAKWKMDGFTARVTWASPFRHGEIYRAAKVLDDPALEMVVLDCMGHSPEYRTEFARLCRRPVVLAQSLVARIVGEVLEP